MSRRACMYGCAWLRRLTSHLIGCPSEHQRCSQCTTCERVAQKRCASLSHGVPVFKFKFKPEFKVTCRERGQGSKV